MTDAYDIYQEVLGIVNKEENGYLPADLFNSYARSATRLTFNDYLSRLQNVQTAAVEKQKLEDRLSPFEMQMPISAAAGFFILPNDYAYFRSARMNGDGGASLIELFALTAQLCQAEEDPTINTAEIQQQIDKLYSQNFVAVQLMDHDQITKRMNSFVPGKKPSLKKPMMERGVVGGKKGFQLYPSIDASVYLNYYRRPAFPKLVMTPAPGGTLGLVYNLALSTPFEFEEEALTDIVNKICTDFATYIREGGLFQMQKAEQKP